MYSNYFRYINMPSVGLYEEVYNDNANYYHDYINGILYIIEGSTANSLSKIWTKGNVFKTINMSEPYYQNGYYYFNEEIKLSLNGTLYFNDEEVYYEIYSGNLDFVFEEIDEFINEEVTYQITRNDEDSYYVHLSDVTIERHTNIEYLQKLFGGSVVSSYKFGSF